MEPDGSVRDVSAPTGDVLLWLERTLVALGLALGLWWLLATAQMRFYASLPVPSTPKFAAIAAPVPPLEPPGVRVRS